MRKFYFFSDNGKSIQLKRIVSKVCEVLVDGCFAAGRAMTKFYG